MSITMDLRFLTTFLEVAKTRHFGKAAENLYLTQSAVSARIKLIEEYFNTSLFFRNRHSIQLTSAGEKLIPFAESMTHTLNLAREALNEDEVSYLVCAASPNASELYLKHAINQFNAHFYDLSLRVEILNTEQLSRQLHERIIDIAFTTEVIKAEDVDHKCLMTDSLALYSSETDQLEQAFENYVHIDWGSKLNDRLLKQFPQVKKAKLKTSAISIAKDQIEYTGGSVFLTQALAEHFSATRPLTLIARAEDIEINTYLVYLKELKNSALSELIKFCIEQ
ncbi:LysR family transcriptional regulator [Glaciecola sp. KUL10]|uniref:LysR family transcriptional regulator n=1 Tax=Glaciecola sp. (strain KUL10) TaxID=2161813 RepID=UPI000D78940B|nr:LysR family transcriptional regulator [Glaciecola sp. KUL10]